MYERAISEKSRAKYRWVWLWLLMAALPLSCSGEARKDEAYLQKAAILNVAGIIGKSKAEVAAQLGKPTSDLPPGKINKTENVCSYKWSEADTLGLIVAFTSGKAGSVSMTLKRPVHSPEAALKFFGVDIPANTGGTATQSAKWWTGTFNGTAYSRIGSTKSSPDGDEWATIKAEK